MLYDLLATLWERPAPVAQLHKAVAFRAGVPTSPGAVERYLRLLAECGYVRTHERDGSPVYALAERGSLLLADAAEQRETAASPTYLEA